MSCAEPLDGLTMWRQPKLIYCDAMFAVVYGTYIDPNHRKRYKALGVRWRGRSKKIGYPYSCKDTSKRLYFVESPLVTKAILDFFKTQPGAIHPAIDDALENWEQIKGSKGDLDPMNYYDPEFNAR